MNQLSGDVHGYMVAATSYRLTAQAERVYPIRLASAGWFGNELLYVILNSIFNSSAGINRTGGYIHLYSKFHFLQI